MYSTHKMNLVVVMLFSFCVQSFAQQGSAKIKKLSENADIILIGKVTKKNSAWNKDKSRIYSKATVKVNEYLKGKSNDSYVEITYPGGEIGEIGELYSHTATFSENEEVLVFLKKDKKNKSYKVYNGKDGKIKVLNNFKTKEKLTDISTTVKDLKSQIKSYINEE